MPTTAQVIAETLKTSGVRRLFGLPGGEIAEVMAACREAGLEFVLTRHENAGCIMAGVTGEISRRPGVALATLGPGATNLVNGVADAYLERAPLVVISAQVSTNLAPILPHQRVDLEDLFRPITKWSHTLGGVDTAATVRHALAITTSGRPGPVYLSLPNDIARQEDRTLAPGATPQPGSPRREAAQPPHAADLSQAAQRIAQARRPIAILGIALDPLRDRPAVLRWLEATGIPVATTPKAKGLVPEDHPLFVATATGMAGDSVFVEFLRQADLLVGVGFDPVEAIRPFYTERPLLSIAAYSLADRSFAPALELVGDVGAILEALQAVSVPHPAWTREEVAGFRRRLAAFLTPAADASPRGLSPARLVARLRRQAPRETILTVDTGAHKLLTGQVWSCHEPLSFFVSHGLSTMGFALPAAVGVKLERPGRPVIAVTGDGGLTMVLGELETAARLRLPIPILVLTDRSLHLIRLHQERKGVSPHGVDFGPIDFAAVAPGFGAHGVRASTWGEFDHALASALTADRPTVIEVPVDPADYDRVL